MSDRRAFKFRDALRFFATQAGVQDERGGGGVMVVVMRGAARLIQSAGDFSSLIKAPCPAMDQSAAW